MQRFEVQKLAMGAYRSMLRGYRLKEIIGQATVPEELLAAFHSGGLLLGPDGLPQKDAPESADKVASKPHVITMSRNLVPHYLGTWTILMFVYQEPILGFARSEQRLLDAALPGVTDEELATELKISLSAVKKTWRSIYSRANRSSSGILPGTLETRTDSSDRGKGKSTGFSPMCGSIPRSYGRSVSNSFASRRLPNIPAPRVRAAASLASSRLSSKTSAYSAPVARVVA